MLYAIAVILLLIYSPTGILGILDRALAERRTKIASARRAPSRHPDWKRRHDRGSRSRQHQETFWRHHRGRRRQL
jgi:hypothetical protein